MSNGLDEITNKKNGLQLVSMIKACDMPICLSYFAFTLYRTRLSCWPDWELGGGGFQLKDTEREGNRI